MLKITLLVTVIVAVLLGALLTAGNRFWREILREEIDARLSSVAESRRSLVQAQLALFRQRAVLNTDRGEFRSFLGQLAGGNVSEKDRAYSEHSLRRITADGLTRSAMLVEPNGRVGVASDPAKIGSSLALDAVFSAGMGEVRIGEPQRVGARFEVRVAAPVRSFSSGEPVCGALVLDVAADEIAAALRDPTGLGHTGEVLLGAGDAAAIRIFFPTRFREGLTLPVAEAPAMVAAIAGREQLSHDRDYRGAQVLAVGRPVGDGGWGLVAKMDEAEAYAPITRALQYGLWLCALTGLVGLAAAFGLARQGAAVRGPRNAERIERGLGKVTLVCALAALFTGLAGLAGWALKIEVLKRVLPGLVAMKPNTALGFILAGAALALRRRRGVRVGCAAAVILLGGMSLAQDLTGLDFGMDRMLFRDVPGEPLSLHSGRMSLVTAISFVLVGFALLLLDARGVAVRRTRETMASLTGAAGLFAMIGYAYGAEAVYRLPGFASVALHTALALLLLALGILCARTDGLAGAFGSAGLGGQIARRFLPLVIVAPLVLGWLVLMAEQAGIFNATQQTAVFSASMVLVLAALVWRNARSLDASDAERRRAEEELQFLNQKLESRVAARTAELQTALTRLEAENAERRQAEERIRELNVQLSARVEELAEVNAELESFGYTVSHDLRAPLRHVAGFIRLLAEGAEGRLDPKTAGYLPLIAKGAERMGQLIDDLLHFSRLGRTDLWRTEVELEPLIEEVRPALQPETEGRAIEWKIGPLPTVHGDRAMLRQVLANLIGNAVKFTRRQRNAAIEITCESAATEHIFRVRDNGAGFDPQYADKLFGVFQRLHSVQEFEGTGIGLATVRRILTRHGGRAWAESKPGHGADFFFSLPKG